MAEAKAFPPQQVRGIVGEVAALLKERKETVSVAETVRSVPYFKNSTSPKLVLASFAWGLYGE